MLPYSLRPYITPTSMWSAEQALWAERPVDGQPRMLARCRRLYRPQVPAARNCCSLPHTCLDELQKTCSNARWLHDACLASGGLRAVPVHTVLLRSAKHRLLCYSMQVVAAPQETVFMSTGSAAELFMSDHIEARVPVADITARCASSILNLFLICCKQCSCVKKTTASDVGLLHSSCHAEK